MKIVHLWSTQDDSGHGWEAKLTGEVLILGRVIERLGLIIRILSMMNSGFVPDGCIECCGESVQISAECQTIRIAVSAVMDSWSGHTIPPSDFSK